MAGRSAHVEEMKRLGIVALLRNRLHSLLFVWDGRGKFMVGGGWRGGWRGAHVLAHRLGEESTDSKLQRRRESAKGRMPPVVQFFLSCASALHKP
eukprot:scaffold10269_cov102-Isochrysis_galbana.AAC.6